MEIHGKSGIGFLYFLQDFWNSHLNTVIMDTSKEAPPDGVEAKWVPGQKGTPLCDNNNYSYRIHMKNKGGTKANYKCVKRDKAKCPAVAVLHSASSRILHIMHEHSHETAHQEEKRRRR